MSTATPKKKSAKAAAKAKPTYRTEYGESARYFVRHNVAAADQTDTVSKWLHAPRIKVMMVADLVLSATAGAPPILACLALIHKVDADPLNAHKRPVVLDYIWTAPDYRAAGRATRLLQHLCHDNQMTAILTAVVDKPRMGNLYRRAGWVVSTSNLIARYPASPNDCQLETAFGATCMISESAEVVIIDALVHNHRGANPAAGEAPVLPEKYELCGLEIDRILHQLEMQFSKRIKLNVFMKACQRVGETLSPLTPEFVDELRELRFVYCRGAAASAASASASAA